MLSESGTVVNTALYSTVGTVDEELSWYEL